MFLKKNEYDGKDNNEKIAWYSWKKSVIIIRQKNRALKSCTNNTW